MKKVRTEKTEEEKEEYRRRARADMEKVRAGKTEEEKEEYRRRAKADMDRVRAGKTEEETIKMKAKARDWTNFCRSFELEWKDEENKEAKARMSKVRDRRGGSRKKQCKAENGKCKS